MFYFLVNLSDKTDTQLNIANYKNIQNVKLSPDSKKVSFVYQSNIYVYDILNDKVTQLTTDGGGDIVNATASHQFDSIINSRDYVWSPDSKFIAFNQFDTSEVPFFTILNNTDSLYPTVKQFQYVKPGETLPSVKVGIVEVATQKIKFPNVQSDDRNHYITNLSWKPNSNSLYIQKFNRNQNEMVIFAADAKKNSIKKIYTEKEDTYVEDYNLQWVNHGEDFLWMSENDGWRHLYKISADGNTKTCLTPGKFDVARRNAEQFIYNAEQFVDEDNQWVYFHASPESSVQRYLYRVPLNKIGKKERLTPKSNIGTNDYQISPNAKWAIRNYSRFDIPPSTSVVKLPSHQEIKIFEDNNELNKKIKEIAPSSVEYSSIEIEKDVLLDYWMIKPSNFDASKKYPVVFHVYSMPAYQITSDLWKGSNYFFYQLLAKKGFIVMGIDGRGTPALKGKEWRKSIYLKHGILPADDIAEATKRIEEKSPYINPEKIGVYGWSGGGLMSLLLLSRHPDIFNTAIPGAFLCHHKYYQAGFTKKFLGTPQQHLEAYEETPALNYVKNIKGNLLLIHGTGDTNVHYQSIEVLTN